jgi:hypothetical protein
MEVIRSLGSLVRRSPNSIEKAISFFEKNQHPDVHISEVQGIVHVGDSTLGERAPRPSVGIAAFTFVHLDPVWRSKTKGLTNRYADVMMIAKSATNGNDQAAIRDGEMHIIVRLRAGQTAEQNIRTVGLAAMEQLPLQIFPEPLPTLKRDHAGILPLPKL